MPETCASARSQFFLSPFVIFVFLFLDLVRCLVWNLQLCIDKYAERKNEERNEMGERCFGFGRTFSNHILAYSRVDVMFMVLWRAYIHSMRISVCVFGFGVVWCHIPLMHRTI